MKYPFFVSEYPARPTAPWKLEIRASFAGKKIRRFFSTEADAWAEGMRLAEVLKKGGTDALSSPTDGTSLERAVKMFLHTKSSTTSPETGAPIVGSRL